MENFTHEQINYEQNTGMLLHVGGFYDIVTSSHWHNGFEIIYITEGVMTVTLRDKEYRLKPGGFAVINCKTIHGTRHKGYCRYLLIQIPYNTIKKNIPEIDSIMIRCIFEGNSAATEKIKEIQDILIKLDKLYCGSHDYGYLLKLNSLVYELLYCIITAFRTQINPELKKKSDKNVQRLGIVLDYVRHHYAENISLSDAADMVALNKEYFSRFFKKYMGQTFMDYVFSVRLECAYYDIVNTDHTIGEIAASCGFENNYRLFVSKFRQRYGCNPAEKRTTRGNL